MGIETTPGLRCRHKDKLRSGTALVELMHFLASNVALSSSRFSSSIDDEILNSAKFSQFDMRCSSGWSRPMWRRLSCGHPVVGDATFGIGSFPKTRVCRFGKSSMRCPSQYRLVSTPSSFNTSNIGNRTSTGMTSSSLCRGLASEKLRRCIRYSGALRMCRKRKDLLVEPDKIVARGW